MYLFMCKKIVRASCPFGRYAAILHSTDELVIFWMIF